jgi:glycerol-3-phosphate dehydrogenase
MAEELSWSDDEKTRQMKDALNFLNTQMGKNANLAAKQNSPITLTHLEISEYVKRFNILDLERKGYLTVNDIRKILKVPRLFSYSTYYFRSLLPYSIPLSSMIP